MSIDHCEDIKCPKCGYDTIQISLDRDQLDFYGECLECGFNFHTEEGRYSLKAVNIAREDLELEPLTELSPYKKV